MFEYSIVETLSSALGAALYRDLPDIEYNDRDWERIRKLETQEERSAALHDPDYIIIRKARPDNQDVEVYLFPQTWGTTALGYGGIGGNASSTAYTVAVICKSTVCVYFGSNMLAYKIDLNELSPEGKEKFFDDLKSFNLAARGNTAKYK